MMNFLCKTGLWAILWGIFLVNIGEGGPDYDGWCLAQTGGSLII